MIAYLVERCQVKPVVLSSTTGLDIFHLVGINKLSHTAYMVYPINNVTYFPHALNANFLNL